MNVCEVCKEIRGKKTILAYELERRRSIGDALNDVEAGAPLGLIVGPEGGIDEAEVEMAMKEKVEPITLGKRILRTETAGMTVLSILVYLLEGRERTR